MYNITLQEGEGWSRGNFLLYAFVCLECLLVLSATESLYPDEEVQAERGGDMQRLQTQRRRGVRKDDWEHLFSVH